MICVVIMATALVALLGNMYPLHMAHEANREKSKAMEVVAAMAERLQGAQWHSLGGSDQPWSWHRRENPDPSSGNPPLREDSPDPDHNLIEQGIINQRTGLEELELHLEYMKMDLAEVLNSQHSWNRHRDEATYILPEDPDVLDLQEEEEAIIFRILVTWRSRDGGSRRHEVVMARRK